MLEIGASGLKQYAGALAEEELRELAGNNGQKRYREMLLDPTIRGCLRAIELLCRRCEWHEEPGGLTPQDEEAAQFLGEIRQDMSHTWADMIAEALTMLVYGWSYAEVVYKPRTEEGSRYADGRIGVRKIAFRSQDTRDKWEFDEAGGIKGLVQRAPPDYATRFIPIEKSLLFRTSSVKNSPEGDSLLRGAFGAWWKKRRIENIEAIGIERNLNGIPVAWVPANLLRSDASSEERATLDAIKKIVRNIRVDEQASLVMPLAYDVNGNKVFDLTLLTVAGKRDVDTSNVVKRYQLEMALSMLADTLLIGHEQVGSKALATTKNALFATAIETFLDIIADTLNRHLVPRLFALNGWDLETLPTWQHGTIDATDLGELGAFLETIARAGAEIFPNFNLTQYLLRAAGLPALPDEEEDDATRRRDAESEAESVTAARSDESDSESKKESRRAA